MSKRISRRFDSVDAMLDYAKRPLPKGANSSAVQSWTTRMVDARYEYDWYGMTKNDTRCPVVYASDMLRTGWNEGVERMESAMTELAEVPASRSVRRRACWSDAGDSIDMQRVYSGQLDAAWRKCTRQSARAPKPVTIWILAGLSFADSTDAIFWRGAACATLADRLSKAGYSVGINAYNCEKSRLDNMKQGPGFDFRLTIKPHSTPLDLASMTAAIALPATIRGALYNAMIIAGQEDGFQIGSGIFVITKTPCPDVQPGDFAGLEKVSTKETAIEWITASIAQLTEQTPN
jgi:hypothetical protein